MSNEDAIKKLEEISDEYILGIDNPFDIAIGAIRRQIPVTPIYQISCCTDKIENINSKTPVIIAGTLCSRCYKQIDRHYKDCNYCNNCGQKIDWS